MMSAPKARSGGTMKQRVPPKMKKTAASAHPMAKAMTLADILASRARVEA